MNKHDCLKTPNKTEEEIRKTRNFDKVEFLDLSKVGSYKVRLVGNPFTFKIPTQYGEKGYIQRFAIYVFDRYDENKLKVMEKGRQLFEQFIEYNNITGNTSFDKVYSPDFKIEMFLQKEKITDFGKYIQFMTSRVFPEPEICPLTPEEIKRFEEDSADLREYFGWSGNNYRKDYHD